MTARLTILLGAGGVGKTTLAAGLALAHARAGVRTALLGVDPARRLRSALALAELPERGVGVPLGRGRTLAAAVLDPSTSLRRWVAEACPDDAVRGRVLANPMFAVLADRLAGLTDAIGCARAAEWAEQDPDLAELVLDTAPGVAAVELLARPQRLLAFFDGRMMRWLVRLARFGRGGRLLAGLAQLSGGNMLRDVGELLDVLDAAIAKLLARLDHARRWLADPTTSLLIVSGVRDDAADATRALANALAALSLAPSLIVLNQTLPDAVATWSPHTDTPQARMFVRYVRSRIAVQARLHDRLAIDRVPIAHVPMATGLDGEDRLARLAALGEPLRARLARADD
jgi:anion-transporting  ArsA/GET3 family ATPase